MRIYLIGMMLSGKTTVGKQLARQLKYRFYDTDILIEKRKKMKISQLINEYGIDYFRNLETEILKQLTKDNAVISTGGGMILREENIDFMKKQGVVIYLKQPIKQLEKRLNVFSQKKRPLLLSKSLSSIFEERKDLYINAATMIIDCGNLDSHEISLKIYEKIGNKKQ